MKILSENITVSSESIHSMFVVKRGSLSLVFFPACLHVACVVQQKDARQWFAELSVDMEKVFFKIPLVEYKLKTQPLSFKNGFCPFFYLSKVKCTEVKKKGLIWKQICSCQFLSALTYVYSS